MNCKKDKWLNILISWLLLLEPILELNFFYKGWEIFNLQINTFIRLIIFFIITLLIILKYKKLQYKKLFIGYILLCVCYFILHHLNSQLFHSLFPGNFNYSIIEEAFYIIRLMMPICLIYYVINIDVDETQTKRSIIICLTIITLIIIISNVFKFSICTYTDSKIIGNIFDWFSNNPGYMFLASRGLFSKVIVFYVVLLFLPYLFYCYFSLNKKSNIFLAFLIFCALISGYMAGTKATTLGILIILLSSLILYIFFCFVIKELKYSKYKLGYLIFLLFFAIWLIQYSPMYSRNHNDKNVANDKQQNADYVIDREQHISIADANKLLSETGQKELETDENDKINIDDFLKNMPSDYSQEKALIYIIENNYQNYGFFPYFMETAYSYKYDPYFWKDMLTIMPYSTRYQNRIVVQHIYDRIFEINDNTYDKFLGITYSRTSKIFNLERDFIYQYYSLGIIGIVIFLSPFIGILLFAIILMLIKPTKYLNCRNCSIILGIALILFLAYYSGNTIDFLGVSLPLGIWCGVLLKSLNNKFN